MRTSAFVVALLALPLLTACGSDDKSPTTPAPVSSAPTSVVATTTGKPSGAPSTTVTAPGSATTTSGSAPAGGLTAPQISKSLQDKGGLDEKTANCIANIYVDEGLSQNGIQKIIDSGYTAGTTNPLELGLTTDDLRKVGTATKRVVKECI